MQQRKPGQAVVIHATQRKIRPIPGNTLTYQELSPEGLPSMVMFQVLGPPGTSTGPEFLRHDGDEALLVLSGRFDLEVGNRKDTLVPGDSVFIPRGALHRLTSAGPDEGELVFVLSPPEYAAKAPPSRAPGEAVVIHAHQRKRRSSPGNPVGYEELSPPELTSMAMFLASAPAGVGTGEKLLQHGGDETMLILEGTFTCEVEDLQHTLEPGDSVFIPRGARHRVTAFGSGSGQAVFVLSPPTY